MRGMGLAGRIKLACSVGVAAWALVCLSPVAANAALTWSQPAFLNAGMGFVSPGLDAVSCPSSTECVAVDSVGREVSFDPSDPADWSAYAIDGRRALAGVSCPATSQCTAVDGRGAAVTFDPVTAEVSSRAVIDPQAQAATGEMGGQTLTGVACPSTAVCVAIDSGGQAVSFAPGSPSGDRTVSFGTDALSVACPSSAQCTVLASRQSAVDGTFQGDSLVTVDPHSLAILSSLALPPTLALHLIACPATGECVAAGFGDCSPTSCSQDGTVTFDPGAAALPTFTPRSSVDFLSLTCAGTEICTAMDASGTATTFDPGASGNIVQTLVDPLGDWRKGFNGAQIACPSIGDCVLATWNSPAAITFAPLNPVASAPVTIDDGAPIAALSCPAVRECVGLANTQGRYTLPTGAATLLDPGRQRHADVIRSLPGRVGGLACPQRTQCTAVTDQMDPGCSDCFARRGAAALTFNPYGPARSDPRYATIDRIRIDGLACPIPHQCTAVDDRGREVTFNPRRPRSEVMYREGARRLTSVACPTIAQCTAVDGHGGEVTFDPRTGALVTSRRIDGRRALASVACPTAAQCSAVDRRGREITFDPGKATISTAHTIDDAALTSIACPSRTLCVAVDSAGNAASGDPRGAHRWALSAIPGATSLLAVACSATRACVATDSIGHAFAAAIRG